MNVDQPFPSEAHVGRRQSQREAVSVMCEARQGTGTWLRTQLLNVSIHGFQIAWFPKCRVELPVWVRLPNLAPLPASVRWKSENGIGCEFDRPLYPAVFEHIVAEAKRQATYSPTSIWTVAR